MRLKEVRGRISRRLQRLSKYGHRDTSSTPRSASSAKDTSTQETSQLSSSEFPEAQTCSLDQSAAAPVPLPPSPAPRLVASVDSSSPGYQTPRGQGEQERLAAVQTGIHSGTERSGVGEIEPLPLSSQGHSSSVPTTVDHYTHVRPAVVEEHIRPHIHTVHHIERTRSIHFHEHRYLIQPIVDPSTPKQAD
jgi:hypothetical protein